MRVLVLSFSNNVVDEESFVPNKMGLTFSCVEECERVLENKGIEHEHICVNRRNIKKCLACGARGWGICYTEHRCIQSDDFNDLYNYMGEFDAYIFITPVYFHEMSESAKTFFDRLKRCDAYRDDSKIRNKKLICIACAGDSGSGTEETLNSFDTLNFFLKTEMKGRIPVTPWTFNGQRAQIWEALDF